MSSASKVSLVAHLLPWESALSLDFSFFGFFVSRFPCCSRCAMALPSDTSGSWRNRGAAPTRYHIPAQSARLPLSGTPKLAEDLSR